jgi:hypothetical protein
MHILLKRIAITSTFVICCLLTHSQPLAYNQQTVDSILKRLPALPDDSQKAESMILLAQMNLQKMDSAQIMNWSRQAELVSEKAGYTKGKIFSLGQRAFYHSISGDWPKIFSFIACGQSSATIGKTIWMLNIGR